MKHYIKTNIEGLVKDPESGAILNIDAKALEAYRRQKRFAKQTNDQTRRLERVEKEIVEIKNMFQQILEKLS